MYNTKCYYSVGWCLMVYKASGCSYKDIVAKVEAFKGWLDSNKGNLEKIVYSYPSGKCFVAKV